MLEYVINQRGRIWGNLDACEVILAGFSHCQFRIAVGSLIFDRACLVADVIGQVGIGCEGCKLDHFLQVLLIPDVFGTRRLRSIKS